jgi:signal transduction histidine kinase/DNA-binding response OmpR family regulator/streptogramin lyase
MVLLPLFLLAACTETSGDRDASLPPTLYPLPLTVELKAGVAIPATPKIIHPDSVAKPQSFVVDTAGLTTIFPQSNRRQVPGEPTTISVDKSQLKTIPLGEGNPDFVLVNTMGDTIPTGVPIPALGKVVKAMHSKPTQALPPGTKDPAIAHLQYLSVEQGMTSSFVNAALEDKSGNIWLGTYIGVSVYNGESFTHYTENEGLSNNLVRSILEDKSGNIWLGTDGGVSVFNGENFTHYTENEGLSNNTIWTIAEDRNGNIWLGTDGGGVSKFDGESFIHYTEKEGLSHNIVISILEDTSGNIWLGTEGGGVSVYNGESFTHYNESEGLSNNLVWSILEDQHGHIWLGTDDGVSLFNGESFTHYTENEGLSNNTVWTIEEDQNGNIWLGTGGGGLSKFNGESFTNYSISEGLSNNTVYSILEDQSGKIWIGTDGGGVNIFIGEGFTHYTENEGLSHNIVLSVMEDQSGNIWAGTGGGGVNVFNEDGFTHYTKDDGLSNNIVWSILEDQRGNIWLGTGDGGVSMFDGESFTHYTETEGLSNNRVRTLLEDRSGNIWLGTDGGVSKYNGESFSHYTEDEGLSNNVVWSILEDQTGNIWVGTEGGGVNVFNGENFTHYGINEGLSNNTVFSIIEDKNGNIWLGTEGGGVSLFDGESFTHFTVNEGVPNNSVWSITEDKSAPSNEVAVFLGTENGLSRISLTEGETSGDKEFTLSIQNFGKQDGLKGLRFTTGAIIDSKNRAWWSTGNGLVMMDLNRLTFSEKIPQPRLSQLEINEQFIDYRRFSDSPDRNEEQIIFSGVQKFENYPLNLKSPYKKNHLTFYFAAIDWAAPHKIRYSYRMVGLNTNWSQPAADPMADYRNLSFGTYTFQIRAIGESGIWSEPFDYSFTILPPWWHTWWAYGMYTLLFLNGLYLLRRYELNRFNLKNQLQLERVETDSLRKLDQLKSHFFANISHEFRTPLTLIIGQIETLLDSENDRNRKKNLISVNNSAGQLLSLINQLLDLSKLEAGKMELKLEEQNLVPFLKNHFFSFESLSETKNINLNFFSTRSAINVRFDTDKMEKVFFNLFSNAIKFTEPGGQIDVSVDILQPNKNVVEIRVKDSGIGISGGRLPYIFDRFYQADSSNTRKYDGTGIGLSIAHEMVMLHNGTIDVKSSEGEGTEFIVRLPIEEDQKAVHLESDVNEQLLAEEDSGSKPLPDFDALLSDHDEIVLIVEDNDDVRSFIAEQLRGKYKILEAANGMEGITVSQGTIPDLIITDLMMPEMDGYAFSEKIRSDEKTSHIPIIMLTAKAGLNPKIEGLELGIDAYLTKPFHVKELKTRVRTLIQQRKKLKQQFSSATYFKPSVISKTPADQNFLAKAIDVIDKNLCNEEFRVEDFAVFLNMSSSQLNRKLNALVDQPAGNFIRSVRLQRSAELLNQTDKPIAEICYDVGFNDQAYFSRVFKKQFGKSPSAFRKLSI